MQQNRRRTRRLALSVLVLCVCAACEGQGLSPAEPSDTGTFDARLSQDVGLQWSPYVGVHLDGRALEAYRDALSALQRAGHLRGVRIEIRKSGQSTSDPVARAIGALGVELLGLISNDHLFEADIEQQIDRIFAAYHHVFVDRHGGTCARQDGRHLISDLEVTNTRRSVGAGAVRRRV